MLMSIFAMLFLSTPSGWRATNAEIERFESYMISIHALRVEGDFEGDGEPEAEETISIHALRVEGDSMSPSTTGIVPGFLSTPSGWRATMEHLTDIRHATISIHALRVEGDRPIAYQMCIKAISIHALRVEGDVSLRSSSQ